MLAIGDAYYYGRGLRRGWSTAFKVYSSAAQHRSGQVKTFPALAAFLGRYLNSCQLDVALHVYDRSFARFTFMSIAEHSQRATAY